MFILEERASFEVLTSGILIEGSVFFLISRKLAYTVLATSSKNQKNVSTCRVVFGCKSIEGLFLVFT